MADPGAGVEPPPGAIPLPGEGLPPNPLETLPSTEIGGFCTINERGIGCVVLW
jgi:hypothetical protein